MLRPHSDDAAVVRDNAPKSYENRLSRASAIQGNVAHTRLGNAGNSGEPSPRLDKPFTLTRDPAVIASVRRNGLSDVIGAIRPDGWAMVYRWSLERYRAALVSAVLRCPNCGTPTPNGGECRDCYALGRALSPSASPGEKA